MTGTSYATPAQWAAYPGVSAGDVPANAALLLLRASRQIDALLISATYPVADAIAVDALQRAAIEQAMYGIEQGWTNGVPGGYASVAIGSVKLDRGPGGGVSDRGAVPEVGTQAFTILQLAGLTGMAPWTG